MSRSAFAREFKTALGVTPMEFVTRIRLHLARRLLASTVRPVETIAAEVGFSSRSQFSRVFRYRNGTDPSSFRRRNVVGLGSEPTASRSASVTRGRGRGQRGGSALV